jgi:hypothetical protein
LRANNSVPWAGPTITFFRIPKAASKKTFFNLDETLSELKGNTTQAEHCNFLSAARMLRKSAQRDPTLNSMTLSRQSVAISNLDAFAG